MARFLPRANEETLPLFNLPNGEEADVAGEIERSRSRSRGHIRTTSAQSRVREDYRFDRIHDMR
jgi:hypothetical protein